MIIKTKKIIQLALIFSLFILLIGVSINFFYNYRTKNKLPSKNIQNITVVGKIVCLPHINKTDPQTLECAIGIQDNNGDYFSLLDKDSLYTDLSKYGNNKVEIKGIVTYRKDSKYQSKGVIDIKEVNLDDAPKRISLSGKYLCLPLKNEAEKNTLECKYGLLSNSKYYAIDFALMSQVAPKLKEGDYIEAQGVFIPLEQLSTDFWQKYPIEGIFSITDISQQTL